MFRLQIDPCLEKFATMMLVPGIDRDADQGTEKESRRSNLVKHRRPEQLEQLSHPRGEYTVPPETRVHIRIEQIGSVDRNKSGLSPAFSISSIHNSKTLRSFAPFC